MAGRGNAADTKRKSRRGTETRQLTAMLGVRMTPQQRTALDASAQREGFKNVKELVMFRLRADLNGTAELALRN